MSPSLICLGLAVPFLVGQLYARFTGQRQPEAFAKILCSGLFLLTAFLEVTGEHTGYSIWITVGLALSMLGDVFMIGKQRRWLAVGLVSFLLAHVAYLVAALPLVSLAYVSPIGLGLTTAGVLIAGLATLGRVGPHLGHLKFPCYVYFAALGLMTIVSVSAWLTEPWQTGRGLLALGAVLFLLSDVAVALQRFLGDDFRTRLWGLPCYYAAQFMLAFSVSRTTGW